MVGIFVLSQSKGTVGQNEVKVGRGQHLHRQFIEREEEQCEISDDQHPSYSGESYAVFRRSSKHISNCKYKCFMAISTNCRFSCRLHNSIIYLADNHFKCSFFLAKPSQSLNSPTKAKAKTMSAQKPTQTKRK